LLKIKKKDITINSPEVVVQKIINVQYRLTEYNSMFTRSKLIHQSDIEECTLHFEHAFLGVLINNNPNSVALKCYMTLEILSEV